MYTLDASKYRLNIKSIQELTKEKTVDETFDFIGNLAIATGVPIIIIGHYLGEIHGYQPKLITIIKRLNAFYGVDKTTGLTCGEDPTFLKKEEV